MADKYTWDDIIINPNDPRLEGAIGKQVYTADSPVVCVRTANGNGNPKELTRIDSDSPCPFITQNSWVCIILKKEPTYEERQAEWIKENDIKIGDKVRAIRIWTNEEAKREGCVPRNYVSNNIVGEVVKILEIKSIGIKIDHKGVRWCLPYFVLEKVTTKYVPFDLSKEDDREFLKGKWIINKFKNHESMITAFKYNSDEWCAHIPQIGLRNGKSLFENFTFSDGTPCGKEVEE